MAIDIELTTNEMASFLKKDFGIEKPDYKEFHYPTRHYFEGMRNGNSVKVEFTNEDVDDIYEVYLNDTNSDLDDFRKIGEVRLVSEYKAIVQE